MPSQKSIYETFLSRHLHGIAGDVTSAFLESLAEVGVWTQVQRGLALLVLDAQVRPVGSYSNNKATYSCDPYCMHDTDNRAPQPTDSTVNL